MVKIRWKYNVTEMKNNVINEIKKLFEMIITTDKFLATKRGEKDKLSTSGIEEHH